MKKSTKITLNGLLAWPIEALVGWAIWNRIMPRIFDLPHLAYWEVLLILVLVGLIFPSTYNGYFSKILDNLESRNEKD